MDDVALVPIGETWGLAIPVILKSTAWIVEEVPWESRLAVPLKVSVYVPAAVALQDTVAVPEPVKLVGVITPQVNPAGREEVSETVPAQWFSAVTVTVEMAETPTSIEAGDEMERVKSWNWNVADAAWMRGPLVPVPMRV